MLDWLQLARHPGSQLGRTSAASRSDQRGLRRSTADSTQGAGLQYTTWRGLVVDYDGSCTNFSSSMNYTLNE